MAEETLTQDEIDALVRLELDRRRIVRAEADLGRIAMMIEVYNPTGRVGVDLSLAPQDFARTDDEFWQRFGWPAFAIIKEAVTSDPAFQAVAKP